MTRDPDDDCTVFHLKAEHIHPGYGPIQRTHEVSTESGILANCRSKDTSSQQIRGVSRKSIGGADRIHTTLIEMRVSEDHIRLGSYTSSSQIARVSRTFADLGLHRLPALSHGHLKPGQSNCKASRPAVQPSYVKCVDLLSQTPHEQLKQFNSQCLWRDKSSIDHEST